ncbi:protein kinase [Echinococcus multilocularis]|uniref:Protein kinase n=1 Tax=Echinococcus multilocularis TaxID=6211 RepID=A0A068Y1P1_ECHMU|nr:protein kinase [Echinococcus multilocularis]
MSRLSMHRYQSHLGEMPEPLRKVAILGKPVFSAGLQFCWQVYEAQLQESKEICSAFVLTKLVIDKTGKMRKREINLEICRKEIGTLRNLQHKRILKIFTESEENCYYLSWISEPLVGTLQSILDKSPRGQLLGMELEIILGVFQVTDALRYLHGTQNLMHCNICPSSIFVNICFQWKLGGFGLAESSADSVNASFTGFNPKGGRNLQPDLDYIAPEVQLHHAMSPLADIFSLGMVICSVFNDGVSLLHCEGSVANYVECISCLPQKFQEISDRIPKPLIEPVRKMISQDVRERPTSQLLALLKLFNEPSLLSYEGLLTLQTRSQNQIKEFFNRFAKAIPEFDEDFRYKKVLPLLWEWYDSHPDLQSFVLPSILAATHIAERADFNLHLHDRLCSALRSHRSKQTSLVALDLVEFFIKYLTSEEIIEIVLPDIASCIRIGSRKSLDPVRNAVYVLHDYLGPEELENHVFPLLKDAIEENDSSGLIQNVMLDCIESLVPHCRPVFVTKDLLIFLASMPTANIEVVFNVAGIFRKVLCDCKFHVPYSLIATKLLPPLIPLLISKKLSLTEFRTLMGVARLMLEQIDRGRTIEYSRKKSLSADEGIMDYNVRTNTGYYRNLPLISMQQPTIDFSRSPPNPNHVNLSRPRSHSSDSNAFSIGIQSSTSPWSSSRQFLSRLRASSQCSETMLQRGSTPFAGLQYLRPQDKTRSNPSFGQRLSLSLLPRASRAASWNNSATALAALKRRRSSSGTSAGLSNDHYDYLGVGSRTGTVFLDPRRHSYGCSGTSSPNSLLTGGVCEGPFSSSPLQSGQGSRRPSAPIFDRNMGSASYPQTGHSPLSGQPLENVFSKIVTSLFTRR